MLVAAYVITDLDIFDIEHYLAYQQALKPLLAEAGACYLARGGSFRIYAGDYQPQRLVVVEFPSADAVEQFYESEGYQALEPQRKACSSANIIAVEGL